MTFSLYYSKFLNRRMKKWEGKIRMEEGRRWMMSWRKEMESHDWFQMEKLSSWVRRKNVILDSRVRGREKEREGERKMRKKNHILWKLFLQLNRLKKMSKWEKWESLLILLPLPFLIFPFFGKEGGERVNPFSYFSTEKRMSNEADNKSSFGSMKTSTC